MSNKDRNIVFSAGGEGVVLNVGYGNFVLAERVVAILESGSLPVKRLRESAAQRNQLLDATSGRKMRSIVVTDSNHLVISALAPHTLQERLRGGKPWIPPAQVELTQGEFIS